MTEEDKAPIGIILLAAGSSSRMGESKQLLIIDGQPLLRRTIKVALDANPDNLIVVLGSNFEEHQKVISDLPVEIVYNENWEKGMGNSIKSGLNHLLRISPSANAVIILVCDQPMLTADHLKKLQEKFLQFKKPVAAMTYSGTFGVPAIFDKCLFDDLLSLSDSMGAKMIIKENSNNITMIPFSEGSLDLDTPNDYLKFRTQGYTFE